VTPVVVLHRRDHELRQPGREVLLLAGAQKRSIKEGGSALGCADAALEEIMRTARRHSLEEIGNTGILRVLSTLPEEREFRLVVRVLMDLAVIEASSCGWPAKV
jgi:hypothetical protein